MINNKLRTVELQMNHPSDFGTVAKTNGTAYSDTLPLKDCK